MAHEVTQRTFAVSTDDPSPQGPWNPTKISIPTDDLLALRGLFAEHYPRHRIVEFITTGLSPIAFIVEVQIKDTVEMTALKATVLLKTVIAAVKARLPALEEAIMSDEGYRASFMWDSSLKNFALHVVCPNSYRPASELYSAVRGAHLSATALKGAWKGSVLQDAVLGQPRSVPLYMGPNYHVLEGSKDAFLIDCVRPTKTTASMCSEPLMIPMAGGHTNISSKSFGTSAAWMVPIEHTVEFLVRMIRSRTRDYDDLCCDVVYTECATISETVIWNIIGMRPRIGMKERSVRFLHWIAKRVAHEEYLDWIYEQSAILSHQFSNEAVTDELFQRLFLPMVEGEYMAVRHNVGSEPTLYYFKNTWRIDHGMRNLSTTISRLITTFVGRELRDYMNKRDQSDLYKVMLSEVVRLNYMTGLRNKTVKALADLLTEEVQFDQDPDILGCSNVVIQYAEKEAFARPGRPEDLISMSTHLHYQKYTEEECAEVKTLFRKLFSDEELRAWFMRLMYSIPFGSNPERAYYVLFGCARNGKSGLLNMLELVLGDYFGRFSSKAFNERKDPSSTSPEIATMVGKRAMVSSELKAGAEMEADILKALTGDDGVPYRALYKNPGVLRMMAKILIASNHFPVFLNADKALRDRTVLIPMEAVFDTRGAPTDELEQYRTGHFPADQHYRQTLQRLAPKMLSMMVEGFAEYRMIGLEPKPQKVRDLCEAYWHEVGVQSRFISDCLEFIDAVSTTVIDVVSILPAPPAPTGRPKLTYTAAYDRFVAWALARQMDVSKYPRFTFKSLMDSELAAMREHKIDFTVDGWVGCRLRA